MICLFLAFRVSTNDTAGAILMLCLAISAVYFFYNSVYFLIWGFNLYQELPESESHKLPESIIVYAIYLICFFVNLVFVAV